MTPTRWQTSGTDSHAYAQHFARAEREGVDLHGEARLVDAIVARGARILDGGCGTGRVGAELARRGHRVTAVDLDPVLIAAAREHHGLDVHRADLATFDSAEPFDAIVLAGNVMVFGTPGAERRVVDNMARLLACGGTLVAGFATDRDYSLEQFHDDLRAAGLRVDFTASTWELGGWHDDATWAVTIARRSSQPTLGSLE